MAVQAQYISNILPDLRNGNTNNLLDADNPSLLASLPSNQSSTLLQDCELVPGTSNRRQIFHSVAPSPSAYPGGNLPSAQGQRSRGNHSRRVFARPRRTQKHVDIPSAVQRRQHPTLSVGNLRQPPRKSPMLCQTSVVVSTGLCLAFDNERANTSTSASGRTEVTSPKNLSTPSADVLALLLQQRMDIDKLLLIQAEQLKEFLEEKRKKHSRALLVAIEESVFGRLRETELELDKINRRNMELEDRAKQLLMEAQMWQTKARSSEAMVTTLRSNLHHAVAQSKEGYGDSEVDDAASAYYDEKVRVCKMCRTNKVSVLLLPCRHLCLCKDCEIQVEICPLCQFVKKASVEVYMC